MSESTNSFFASSRLTLVITLIVLFSLALGIRLYDLTNPPLDFHPTRQLLSALKARGMFLQGSQTIPDWQRRMAVQQWKTRAEVEPEVFERLVAFTYRLTGEQLWVARIYSSLFWLVGGYFLFLLIRDLISTDGAVLSTAYYLFFPYAVIASRSFQPDPLMVMLIIMFWWLMLRWTKAQSWGWALLAGLVGGFAIYIKFVSAFFVVGAALGAVFGHFNARDFIRKPQIWVMAVLGIMPAAAYIYYGTVLHGFLGRQFSGRFIPALLLSPLNYIQWASMANLAAGGVAIVLGLLGLLFFRDRSKRVLLFWMWGAYILFCLFFDYHVATHDYYHLPLIPLVAISFAALADALMVRLKEMTPTRWLRVAAYGIFIYGLLLTAWDIRAQLKSIDYRPQVSMWAGIGAILGHSPNVVALTQDYGSRLAYWGWQDAMIWPNSGDIDYHEARGASFNSPERFTKMTSGNTFFIVTDFAELGRQPDLKKNLDGFSIYAQGDGYIIYDLQAPKTQ